MPKQIVKKYFTKDPIEKQINDELESHSYLEIHSIYFYEIFCIVVYNILIESNFEINTFGLSSLPHISPSNPCEKCDFYKKIKNFKEPYIGDLPCAWCINNPLKIS